MLDFLHQPIERLQLALAWFDVQALPVQIVVGGVVLALLWVLWILLRVILAALRAAFRGL